MARPHSHGPRFSSRSTVRSPLHFGSVYVRRHPIRRRPPTPWAHPQPRGVREGCDKGSEGESLTAIGGPSWSRVVTFHRKNPGKWRKPVGVESHCMQDSDISPTQMGKSLSETANNVKRYVEEQGPGTHWVPYQKGVVEREHGDEPNWAWWEMVGLVLVSEIGGHSKWWARDGWWHLSGKVECRWRHGGIRTSCIIKISEAGEVRADLDYRLAPSRRGRIPEVAFDGKLQKDDFLQWIARVWAAQQRLGFPRTGKLEHRYGWWGYFSYFDRNGAWRCNANELHLLERKERAALQPTVQTGTDRGEGGPGEAPGSAPAGVPPHAL